jgi:transposase
MDVHSRLTAFHILDAAGQRLNSGTFPTNVAAIGEFCLDLPKLTLMFVEASTNSAWFARQVETHGHRVTVVDPNRIRAISMSPKKTDAHDAETLASLGRAGLLTRVHIRSEETDRFRKLLTIRYGMVRARSSLIVMTRALYRSEGHLLPKADGDAFGTRLTALWKVPVGFEEFAQPLSEVTRELTARILSIEKRIEEKAREDEPALMRLTGIPGVGLLIATSFMALLETPIRFSNASQVSAYLGLAPWVDESAGKRKAGHITKRGNRMTRALLVQAARTHVNSSMDTALKRWYRKVAARVGERKAIIGLARKLSELMWAIWRKEEAYQPFPSSSRRTPV